MKNIELINSVSVNSELLGDLINPHLQTLLVDRRKNKQKILETCHVGKFLLFFESNLRIKKLSEKPDFILEGTFGNIGLEHLIIIDSKVKKKEGFYENIFEIVEIDILADSQFPNILVSCILHPHVNFKLSDKLDLIKLVKKIIYEFVFNDNFIENPLIDRISKMPHSQKSINVNLGAWWKKNITVGLIESAIKKKEKKLTQYLKNNVESHWLLIVIGGNGDSSYDMDISLKIEIETSFDKIFILEDFNKKLYELK